MMVRRYNSITAMLSGAHLLIGGTTGSGKTVLLNSIIYQLMSDSEAKFVLIDPKRVGLYKFRKTILCEGYETDVRRINTLLDNCIAEMEKRYKRLIRGHAPQFKLYIIIDELADLMLEDKKHIMPKLQKLLQLGREAEIHLICATQCPNRKIIPAELTLNFTERLALRCVSAIESRQIIGQSGAENLPQHGWGLLSYSEGVRRAEIPMIEENHLNEFINFRRRKLFGIF